MKNKLILILGLLCICSLFFVKPNLASVRSNPDGAKRSYSQIILPLSPKDKQLEFGISEISKNATEKGLVVLTPKAKMGSVFHTITVQIVSDSVQLDAITHKSGLKAPLHKGWQCYSIRKNKTENNLEIWVLASDNSGAIYGCLDIAEAIKNQTLDELKDSDNKPFLLRRGIKFNVPLDLRTPSYSDFSDSYQQNIPVMWEMDFWKQQLDEMARNRYNTMSLWSLNPFASMVKVPEFPDLALNDVWRTTYEIGDKYGFTGYGNKGLPDELLKNYEVVKKMTIREKIKFWQQVMEYAHNRGIDIYMFTWNIFTHAEMGKYGITPDRNNETTMAYFRAAVREMVLTYPYLAGFGITAGENMREDKSDKYTKEQWL
jgi:hypothetical protein